MRQFGTITQWLYQRIALILVVLLCLGTGVALSGTFEFSETLVKAQALQHARVSVHTVKEAWFLYSQAVIERLNTLDTVTISPNYHQITGGIPLPATYTIELGERVSQIEEGLSIRLFSDYPFPNRQTTGGPQNLFEQQALTFLKQNPQSSFYQQDKKNGHLVFRYAEAIQMQPSCIKCHNTWPGSPKTDWQVGDVRGVLEVIQSMDVFVTQSQAGLRSLWLTFIVIGCLAVTSLILVISYLQNANQILQSKVTEKTSALIRLAHFDSLTELANRRCFDQVLEQEWRRMERQQQPLALMMCDVDYFKRYNDAYGHQAGDQCLRKIAQAIQDNVRRTGDLAARYGGEEFAIVMPNTDHYQAWRVAEKIQQAIWALQIDHHHSDVAAQITLSIGIASRIPKPMDHPTHILRVADNALYEAKVKGRNQIVVKLPETLHTSSTNFLS